MVSCSNHRGQKGANLFSKSKLSPFYFKSTKCARRSDCPWPDGSITNSTNLNLVAHCTEPLGKLSEVNLREKRHVQRIVGLHYSEHDSVARLRDRVEVELKITQLRQIGVHLSNDIGGIDQSFSGYVGLRKEMAQHARR